MKTTEPGDPLDPAFRGPPEWDVTLILTINELTAAIEFAQKNSFSDDAKERLARVARRAERNTPVVALPTSHPIEKRQSEQERREVALEKRH